jgi:hypothetical protein
MVLKYKDTSKYLTLNECHVLEKLLQKIKDGRAMDGKLELQAVVVEHDWPEYEPIWDAIQRRMEGRQTLEAELQSEVEQLKQSHDFAAKRLRVLARAAGCEEGVPDDATAVACAGTVLGMIRRNVGQIVSERDRYKLVIARLEGEITCLQSLVPHPGDGTCDRCGMGGAQTVTVTLCEECRELEREIAYHAARSDIECICEGNWGNSAPNVVWYDILSPDNDDDRLFISQAVTYLESRKLLKRHPGNSNLVRPLDAEAVQL